MSDVKVYIYRYQPKVPLVISRESYGCAIHLFQLSFIASWFKITPSQTDMRNYVALLVLSGQPHYDEQLLFYHDDIK